MNAPIDLTGIKIKTPRLLLRPFKKRDLADFNAYAKVDGVGQMAGWLPHRSLSESEGILARFIAGKRTFALEFEGKVIGSLGVELYPEERFPRYQTLACRELGFVLAKDYWGRGLMPEAVEAALRWLFEEKQLDAVFCAHFLRNTQSARVQEKCGFRHLCYGTYQTRYGTVEDDETNVLTRAEWEKRLRCKEIRRGDEAGIEALSAMATQIVREYYDPLIGKAQNDYMLEKFQSPAAIRAQLLEGYRYFTVFEADRPIGFFGFYPRGGALYLSKFYLYKDDRGRGFARPILNFLADAAFEENLGAIELNVNRRNPTVAIYEALGFERIRAECNDIGGGYFMDDYVYRLPL